VITGNIQIILWISYVYFYQFFIPSETYRVYYILSTLLLGLIITILLKQHQLEWKFIENVLLGVVMIHLVVIFLQVIKIPTSPSMFFSITGCNEDPSSTAIYLTCCITIVLHRIIERKSIYKKRYLVFLVLMTIAIFLLKCRTAYIGMILILIFYLCKNHREKINSLKLWMKISALVSLVVLGLTFVIGMYHFKQTSSEGRLLIWKITSQMIKERPCGYGYGMFEKCYNLRQSLYFAKGNGTDKEINNADFVSMPCNDILEQGVEGGIAGALFYLLFYLNILWQSYRKRDFEGFTIVISLLFMSMTNFVYTSVQVWLLLMCFGGKVMAVLDKATESNEIHLIHTKKVLLIVSIFIFAMLFFQESKVIKAQMNLTSLHESIELGVPVMANQLSDLQTNIETSELYYTDAAISYMQVGEYANAIKSLKESQKYTSSPKVYYLLSRCYMEMHDAKSSIAPLNIVRNMLPHHFLPNLLLMRGYKKYGHTEQALNYAHKIMDMPVKIESEKVERIKEEAKQYIESNEK
jgi:O-antigen polymerase